MAVEIRLAGCSIEDHIGDPDAPIYEFDLAVKRIEAASEAGRQLPGDFVFTARCENILWGCANLATVIERLQAYEGAGQMFSMRLGWRISILLEVSTALCINA